MSTRGERRREQIIECEGSATSPSFGMSITGTRREEGQLLKYLPGSEGRRSGEPTRLRSDPSHLSLVQSSISSSISQNNVVATLDAGEDAPQPVAPHSVAMG